MRKVDTRKSNSGGKLTRAMIKTCERELSGRDLDKEVALFVISALAAEFNAK